MNHLFLSLRMKQTSWWILGDWQLLTSAICFFGPTQNGGENAAMDDDLDDDDRALRRFHGPRNGDDAKSVRVLLFGEALAEATDVDEIDFLIESYRFFDT